MPRGSRAFRLAPRSSPPIPSAAWAGLAGVFITARVGSSDPTNFGVLVELDAIASVVVGGTPLAGGRARVFGTLVGALLLQLVTAAMIMNNVSFQYSLIVKAAIILIAVYLQ